MTSLPDIYSVPICVFMPLFIFDPFFGVENLSIFLSFSKNRHKMTSFRCLYMYHLDCCKWRWAGKYEVIQQNYNKIQKFGQFPSQYEVGKGSIIPAQYGIIITQNSQSQMKSAQMGVEQTSKMFIKFFDFNYDMSRLASNMKRTVKQIQIKLKQEIKSLLIDLEGDLLRSKRITNVVFLNLINPQIEKKLIHIDKILDKKSAEHFLNYYRSRLIEFNLNMPHHLETVYPISVDSRISIYRQFVQYARNQHLLNELQKQNPETALDIIKKGFVEDRHEVYDQKQLDLLFVIYQKNNGNVDAIYEQIQNRGLKDRKYERPILQFKLANLKLLGLHKVYTLGANWMDDNLLRWNKFIKCYGNLFVNWTEEDQKKLLRIAVTDQPTVDDMKHITLKMGSSSAQLQKCVIQHKKQQAKMNNFSFREQPRRTYREPVIYINPRIFTGESYQELSPENYYEPVKKYHQEPVQEFQFSDNDQFDFDSDEYYQQSPEPNYRERYEEPSEDYTSNIKQKIKKKIVTKIHHPR